jgi:hypothetical protein
LGSFSLGAFYTYSTCPTFGANRTSTKPSQLDVRSSVFEVKVGSDSICGKLIEFAPHVNLSGSTFNNLLDCCRSHIISTEIKGEKSNSKLIFQEELKINERTVNYFVIQSAPQIFYCIAYISNNKICVCVDQKENTLGKDATNKEIAAHKEFLLKNLVASRLGDLTLEFIFLLLGRCPKPRDFRGMMEPLWKVIALKERGSLCPPRSDFPPQSRPGYPLADASLRSRLRFAGHTYSITLGEYVNSAPA